MLISVSPRWLVLEPFITPALFEPFNAGAGNYASNPTPTVIDEWTLSVALGTNLQSTIEEHYKTFIVRWLFFSPVPESQI